MRNIKPRTKYSGISLPDEFMDSIKRHVLSKTDYKSIAEFTKDAVREKMQNDILKKPGTLSGEEKATQGMEFIRELIKREVDKQFNSMYGKKVKK